MVAPVREQVEARAGDQVALGARLFVVEPPATGPD
jgi:hypothetical protein